MSEASSPPPLERKESWQTERTQIKEYQWHVDIHKTKYTDYTAGYIFWYIVGVALTSMYFVHYLLDAWMIYNLFSLKDYFVDGVQNHPQSLEKTCLNATASSNSTLPTCSSIIHELNGMVIAYIVFTGVCVVINIYDAIIAARVVMSQDVSDAFINVMASQWICTTSYSRFCFFQVVGAKKTSLDTFSMFLFQTLYQTKQFVADIPMFIIAYLYADLSGEFAVWYNQGSAYAKFIFLALRFAVALFCMICYPLVRVFWVKGSLRKYASYRIDKLIELVLWPETHPGQVKAVGEEADGATFLNSGATARDGYSSGPPSSSQPPPGVYQQPPQPYYQAPAAPYQPEPVYQPQPVYQDPAQQYTGYPQYGNQYPPQPPYYQGQPQVPPQDTYNVYPQQNGYY